MLFGGRWRRDEHAWGVWQGIEPLIPVRFPIRLRNRQTAAKGRNASGLFSVRKPGSNPRSGTWATAP